MSALSGQQRIADAVFRPELRPKASSSMAIQESLWPMTATRDDLVATDGCGSLLDAGTTVRLLTMLEGNFGEGVRTP